MFEIFCDQTNHLTIRVAGFAYILTVLVPVCRCFVSFALAAILSLLLDRLVVVSKNVYLVIFGELKILAEVIHGKASSFGAQT